MVDGGREQTNARTPAALWRLRGYCSAPRLQLLKPTQCSPPSPHTIHVVLHAAAHTAPAVSTFIVVAPWASFTALGGRFCCWGMACISRSVSSCGQCFDSAPVLRAPYAPCPVPYTIPSATRRTVHPTTSISLAAFVRKAETRLTSHPPCAARSPHPFRPPRSPCSVCAACAVPAPPARPQRATCAVYRDRTWRVSVRTSTSHPSWFTSHVHDSCPNPPHH